MSIPNTKADTEEIRLSKFSLYIDVIATELS